MITYDPHDDSFIAKNLREEEWFVYRQDTRTLNLAESIKEIINQGLVAKIKSTELYDLGLEIAFKAAIPAILLQPPWHGEHWAGLALCMLTHAYMEPNESEQVTRFYKSPYNQEPMYYDNVEWVTAYGRNYLVPARKKVMVIEKPKPNPVQTSLFDF